MPDATAETERAAKLLEAQVKSYEFFDEIDKIIRPGVTEKALSEEIYKIGLDRFGIKTHWHKRVIRSGPNTLSPFSENPPDRVIQDDDILIVDLGPVLEKYEADIGKTYVLGLYP